MDTARKFSFGPSLVDASGKVILPEVEQAREQGYEAGFEAGLAKAHGELEADIAAMVAVMNLRLSELSARQQDAYQFVTGSTVELVKAIVKKVIPHAISKYGDEEVTCFAQEVLKDLNATGAVHVHVHPDLATATEKIMQEECCHPGVTISVKADDSLERTDCRVEWDDGGVDCMRSELIRQVDQALDRVLANQPTPPAAETVAIEEEKSEGEENV